MSAGGGFREPFAVYDLSVRVEQERGGPVRPEVSDPDGIRARRIRHLLILVHGFNNTATAARDSFNTMIDLLRPGMEQSRIAPDAVARFQWPGNVAIGYSGTLDFLGYADDIEQARQSAERLFEFLNRLYTPGPGAMKISVIGHSLGCRLLLETLARQKTIPDAPIMDVVCLMAPAVPVALCEPAQWLRTESRARVVLKAHSWLDFVLSAAFPAGQLLARLRGIEQAAYGEAVGLYGRPDSYGESFPTYNSHGGYWKDQSVAEAFLERVDPTLRRPLSVRGLPAREPGTGLSVPSHTLPPVRALN